MAFNGYTEYGLFTTNCTCSVYVNGTLTAEQFIKSGTKAFQIPKGAFVEISVTDTSGTATLTIGSIAVSAYTLSSTATDVDFYMGDTITLVKA